MNADLSLETPDEPYTQLFSEEPEPPSRESSYEITPFAESNFYKATRKRQANNKDFQAILTSRSAERGLGKTTLGIHLCRIFDLNGWSAEEKSFMDVNEYIEYYISEADSGDILLQDETEIAADRRRSMSHDNVEFSQVISACRFKEVGSIYTLPTRGMLDSRIFGLCTWWIHVVSRGTAAVYYIAHNDYTGDVITIPVTGKTGNQEFIYFPDLVGDPDKDLLDTDKETYMTDFINSTFRDGEEKAEVRQKAAKEQEREIRDRLIEHYVSDYPDLTQKEVADTVTADALQHFDHITSVSQQTVSNINQDM